MGRPVEVLHVSPMPPYWCQLLCSKQPLLIFAGQGYTLYTNQAYATGSDLYNFYCAGGQCLTAYDCATYCKNTVECAAFTYVNGLCNLKSATTNLVATNGAYAGLITQTNVVAPPYVGAPSDLCFSSSRF